MKLRNFTDLFARPTVAHPLQRRLVSCHSIEDLRQLARRRVPRAVFDFIDGGAEDELTLRRNRAAIERRALLPNVLTGNATVDLSREVLGQRRRYPFAFSPTGFSRVAHREGELAVARAACEVGVPYTVSAAANFSMEAVAAVSPGPLWFGLYPWRERAANEDLISRARASGYDTLFLTADVPVAGGRERDLRNGFTIPPRLSLGTIVDGARRPRWSADFLLGEPLTIPNTERFASGPTSSTKFPAMFNPALTWDDLAWFIKAWNGRFVLKGILSGDDARRAVDAGVDAVVVSNHGGRQLDGAVASLDALEEIVEAVGNEIEVLIDSGFRRGREIAVALALGARAVLVGRPYLYGLAAAGQAGVRHAVEILAAELERTLHLLGVDSVDSLTRSSVIDGGPDGPFRRA